MRLRERAEAGLVVVEDEAHQDGVEQKGRQGREERQEVWLLPRGPDPEGQDGDATGEEEAEGHRSDIARLEEVERLLAEADDVDPELKGAVDETGHVLADVRHD